MVEAVAKHIPIESWLGIFNDTYGQVLANTLAALECGIATFDSLVAGLGGCPYAKGATGNVASEDVLYMLDGLGIETGVATLMAAGDFICDALGCLTLRVARARRKIESRMIADDVPSPCVRICVVDEARDAAAAARSTKYRSASHERAEVRAARRACAAQSRARHFRIICKRNNQEFVMPLSAPAPRQPMHNRAIECRGLPA